MSWFPQIGAGSMAQFPLQRSRKWRAIVNDLESGERIMLPDTAAGQLEWQLSYQELTDAETATLSSLFSASQGGFETFTFIDPMANLLGWSENLSQPNWQAGLLQCTSGVTDPLGTQRAWSLANGSAGTQQLQQTLGVPGAYVACFSAYFRAATAGTITMSRDSVTATATIGPGWTRAYVSGLGSAGATQSTFSVAAGAGQTIQVFGLQVEAQPYPSLYKQTTTALGIYEETWFGNDVLTITGTSPGFSSCNIVLVSRVSGD
jgi:hypothetical protein